MDKLRFSHEANFSSCNYSNTTAPVYSTDFTTNSNDTLGTITTNCTPTPDTNFNTSGDENYMMPGMSTKATFKKKKQAINQANQTQFLGGLKPYIKKEDIYNHFSKFGQIDNIALSLNPKTGCNKGYSFVNFKDSSVIPNILKKSHYLENRKVECKISYGGEFNKQERQESAMCKIFVKKLKKNTNDNKLFEYFSQFGYLKNAYVICDPENGRSKGFGYVQFDSREVIDYVLSISHTIDDRHVLVSRFELQQNTSGQNGDETIGSPYEKTKGRPYEKGYPKPHINMQKNYPVSEYTAEPFSMNRAQPFINDPKNASYSGITTADNNYGDYVNGYHTANFQFYNPENPYSTKYANSFTSNVDNNISQTTCPTYHSNTCNGDMVSQDYKENKFSNYNGPFDYKEAFNGQYHYGDYKDHNSTKYEPQYLNRDEHFYANSYERDYTNNFSEGDNQYNPSLYQNHYFNYELNQKTNAAYQDDNKHYINKHYPKNDNPFQGREHYYVNEGTKSDFNNDLFTNDRVLNDAKKLLDDRRDNEDTYYLSSYDTGYNNQHQGQFDVNFDYESIANQKDTIDRLECDKYGFDRYEKQNENRPKHGDFHNDLHSIEFDKVDVRADDLEIKEIHYNHEH